MNALSDVAAGILPPGFVREPPLRLEFSTPIPPGRMPCSTSGKMPDTTFS